VTPPKENGRGGFQLQAAMPIKRGEPVVLGPSRICAGGESGWYTLRVRNGWPDDFGIFHAGAGNTLYDITTPTQPHGHQLTVSNETVNLYPEICTESVLFMNGQRLLDPDSRHAPELPWRKVPFTSGFGASFTVPPPEMPWWYFLDHSSVPNLSVSKQLYKIEKEGTATGFKRAIVFEACTDIRKGEWLSFCYDHHLPQWCSITPCPGCCSAFKEFESYQRRFGMD